MTAPSPPRHRRCIVLQGERDVTLREASRLVSALAHTCVVGGGPLSSARTRQLLGQSFDAVVLDLHDGVAADTIGRCHGLVRGGGALVLCLPPAGRAVRRPELAVYPYTSADVGERFWHRLERHLGRLDTTAPATPLPPPPDVPLGSAEQASVIARLTAAFVAPEPSFVVLLAERGRGKSSSLGLALARALASSTRALRVTAPHESAAAEVFRFAPPDGERLRYLSPAELLTAEGVDVIAVDEAAQLPVPLLQAIVARHPRATLAFATTTQGYEGTGGGFVLRFLDWLEREARPTERLTLEEPIRWSRGDPLERFVDDLLALDAEVATLLGAAVPEEVPAPARAARAPRVEPGSLPAPRRLLPAELARDEALLRSLFGLLIHAHYRTTPADLERLLDAPNLMLYAAVESSRVLGATLVAREGGLPRLDCEALARGEWRIRGHALADTLIVHAGRPEAGELSLLRSVRIATHPELRRHGIARALVEHVHAAHAPDLFGTVFGATPELLEFRRALGYRLVRVGSARGVTTGEPSAVMVRAASERGRALLEALEDDLARNLPLQLELLAADSELGLDPALRRALLAGLPTARELDAADVRRRVEAFVHGAQTMEAASYALGRFLRAPELRLERLEPRQRRLLEARVLLRRSWRAAAQAASYPDVPTAMRALRPALRQLLEP